MATRKNLAAEALSTLNRSNVKKEKSLIAKNPTVDGGVEMEVITLTPDNTMQIVSDIDHTLELLEKIGEQQKAAVAAEIAELDQRISESEELRLSKPYYTQVKMSITEATVLTPREVLMAQEVSTENAIAFTDQIKSVRSLIRKINKKGERTYTAILKEKTLYVWRVK